MAMLLAKAAGWQDPATKAFHLGVFVLYPTKITWQPDAARAPAAKELHVGLIAVTNTQRAKTKPMLRLVAGTADYTFQFDSLLDRDAAVDGLTKAKEQLNHAPLAAQAQPRNKAAPASAAGPSVTTASAAVQIRAGGGTVGAQVPAAGLPAPSQKREMLKADAELGERYNALVAAAGILTEDEFWQGVMAERLKSAAAAAASGAGAGAATAKSEGGAGGGEVLPLPNPPDVPEQRKGLSNAMFQVPVEQDGRTVSMRFTLTTEIIAMVFAEKPHVRRAYQKNVPVHMSEKEFWTRYIKHEMAKEERRKRLVTAAAGRGGSDAAQLQADTAPLEHTSLFNEGEAGTSSTGGGEDGTQRTQPGSERRVRQKLARADPTVNLAADAADGFSQGFGLLHAANKVRHTTIGTSSYIISRSLQPKVASEHWQRTWLMTSTATQLSCWRAAMRSAALPTAWLLLQQAPARPHRNPQAAGRFQNAPLRVAALLGRQLRSS